MKVGLSWAVAGARIISGLVPANVVAEEILTDHPARYRAMIVESANPAHSLADSKAMREALAALDLVVVIDVAMTETARLAQLYAQYRLLAASNRLLEALQVDLPTAGVSNARQRYNVRSYGPGEVMEPRIPYGPTN